MSKPKQPPHRNSVWFNKSHHAGEGFTELQRDNVRKLVKKLKSYLCRYHNYASEWRLSFGGADYMSAYVMVPKGFVEPTTKFLTRRGFFVK